MTFRISTETVDQPEKTWTREFSSWEYAKAWACRVFPQWYRDQQEPIFMSNNHGYLLKYDENGITILSE